MNTSQLDTIILSHKNEVDKFKSSVANLTSQIEQFKVDQTKNQLIADNMVKNYENEIQQLEQNVSDYKKKLTNKPAVNTCPAAFSLIVEEVKGAQKW